MPGLSCNKQDLWSLLQHVGSNFPTRDWTQAPCNGSMRILATRPPEKSHRPFILQTGNSGPEWRRSYSNDSEAGTGTRTPGSQDRVTAAAQPESRCESWPGGWRGVGSGGQGPVWRPLEGLQEKGWGSYEKGQGLRIWGPSGGDAGICSPERSQSTRKCAWFKLRQD